MFSSFRFPICDDRPKKPRKKLILRLSLQHGHQIPALLQLLHNVQAPDQVTLDIELRVGGPVGIGLEALTHLLVLQNVEGVKIHPGAVQNLQCLLAKSTPGRLLVALHEQHDGALVDQGLEAVLHGHGLRAGVGQLAGHGQLLHDVQSAHQLPVGVQLWVRGPVGVGLQALTHLLVGQDVKGAELDAVLFEQGHDLPAEAAAGLLRGALHEEHARGRVDELL